MFHVLKGTKTEGTYINYTPTTTTKLLFQSTTKILFSAQPILIVRSRSNFFHMLQVNVVMNSAHRLVVNITWMLFINITDIIRTRTLACTLQSFEVVTKPHRQRSKFSRLNTFKTFDGMSPTIKRQRHSVLALSVCLCAGCPFVCVCVRAYVRVYMCVRSCAYLRVYVYVRVRVCANFTFACDLFSICTTYKVHIWFHFSFRQPLSNDINLDLLVSLTFALWPWITPPGHGVFTKTFFSLQVLRTFTLSRQKPCMVTVTTHWNQCSDSMLVLFQTTL